MKHAFFAALFIVSASFAQTTKPTTAPSSDYPALRKRLAVLEKENEDLKKQVAEMKKLLAGYVEKEGKTKEVQAKGPEIGMTIDEFVKAIGGKYESHVTSESQASISYDISYSEIPPDELKINGFIINRWGSAVADKTTKKVISYTKAQ